MTWVGLVVRNLLRRPVRTALTAAGVSLGVGLIVALLSITNGAKRTAAQLIHIGRADFGLFQTGTADLTQSLLPESLARAVAREPGVASTGRIFLFSTTKLLVFGYARHDFPARRLVIVQGSLWRDGEALLGDAAARRLRLRPGTTLRLGSRSFRVAGIYHSGNPFVDNGGILPLRAVQQLARRPNEVTSIAVTVSLGARPKAVAKQLERDFPNTVAVTEPGQVVRLDTSLRLIVTTGWIISLLALIVGGIAVTNTMAMAVFERVREIGILRAVGWPARRIGALIVSEALAICLLALAAGLALGYAAGELFTNGSSGTLVQPDFTSGVFAWGLAFALGVGVLGAVYPTLRATRLSPIEALRRE
ncbi:MAG: ABC transporter permease [Gaiellaceae bacterium]